MFKKYLVTLTGLTFLSLLLFWGCKKSPTESENFIYEIFSVYWNNQTDTDGDSYSSYRQLVMDVDVQDEGTHSIYAKIYTKPAASGTYTLYFTTSNFSITGGSSSDLYYISVGSPNTELANGIYDFMIEIYEAGGSTVKATESASTDFELDDEFFEMSSEDAFSYTIFTAYWSNSTDTDVDGYTSYRRLNFDVDVNSGTHSVYAKIYSKPSASGTYTLYFTSSNFSITGSSGLDEYYVSVGSPNTELSNGTYDFMIEIYEAGGLTVQVTRDPTVDTDLDNQQFETNTQDTPAYTYSIWDAYWSNSIDGDVDGYTSYRQLNFDVDVSSGTHNVYAIIYSKPSTSGIYTLYFTTSDFSITGASGSDVYYISVGSPNTELSNGTYDFKIEIYESAGIIIMATEDETTDLDLNDENFELTSED